MLDPYWQKQDFLRRNPQFKTPTDPITSAGQVSVPEEISNSPEISFSGQTTPPSTYETGQVSNNRPLANGLFDDISDPELDLANELPTTNSAPSLSLTNGAAVRKSSQQPVAEFSSTPDGLLPSGQVYTSISDEFVIKRSRKQQQRRHLAGYVSYERIN